MPRRSGPPQDPARVLFYLRPLNVLAEVTITHPDNKSYRTQYKGFDVLAVGAIRSRAGGNVLVTLGRSNCDIHVPDDCVSKSQCSFHIDWETNVIMLHDDTTWHSTQLTGPTAFDFKDGEASRKVVVREGLNTDFRIGSGYGDVPQFRILWNEDVVKAAETLKHEIDSNTTYVQDPRLAQTRCEGFTAAVTVPATRTRSRALTVVPSRTLSRRFSQSVSRVYRLTKGRMRWFRIGHALGAGAFGVVYPAVDVDTGLLVAVKTIQPAKKAPREDELMRFRSEETHNVQREVDALKDIAHPHIIDLVAHQGWGELQIEIIMELAKGSLKSLIEHGQLRAIDIVQPLFHQMLQAIDCLRDADLLHRDIKPENILYTAAPPHNDCFVFKLGDFGVAVLGAACEQPAGTLFYMAPEVMRDNNQTEKMDIWSLFVTVLWTLDVNGFRRTMAQGGDYWEMVRCIYDCATVEDVADYREMGSEDPDLRPSAAQLLMAHFDGRGLTMDRAEVPPWRRNLPDQKMIDAPPNDCLTADQVLIEHLDKVNIGDSGRTGSRRRATAARRSKSNARQKTSGRVQAVSGPRVQKNMYDLRSRQGSILASSAWMNTRSRKLQNLSPNSQGSWSQTRFIEQTGAKIRELYGSEMFLRET